MPFGALSAPALGLSQLQTVLRERFGDRISVELVYANHDFARAFDEPTLYSHVMSNAGFATGLGDWIFRPAAFPSCADNSDAYFSQYYPPGTREGTWVPDAVSRVRSGLNAFCDDLVSRYRLDAADIVGFSCIFSQTTPSLAVAHRLKARNPSLVTLMGGAACTGEPGVAFAEAFESIDYVFSGSARVSLTTFVERILAGQSDAGVELKGVFCVADLRGGTGPVAGVGEGPTALLGDEPDIEDWVEPDYEPFLDAFETTFAGRPEAKPRLLFETSRGCWWAERSPCRFCGLNGPCVTFRAMSADAAVAQIGSLLRYAPRCTLLASVDNVVPENYVVDVFPRLELGPDHTLQYEVRVNLEEEQLSSLCKAGVRVIQPGIESLSTGTLRRMRKGTTAFDNIRFLKACSRFPVSVGWSLLVFSPGESDATYQCYLDLMPRLQHLHPPLAAYPVEFVRYSDYVEHAQAHGLVLAPEPFYELTYDCGPDMACRLAHKFRNVHADLEAMHCWLRRLNEAIGFWRRRWLGEDGNVQARLCMTTDSSGVRIHDARSGAAVEYSLRRSAAQILNALDAPLTTEELRARCAGPVPIDVRAELALLADRGLVFEEDGRYLSLVVVE